jgi:hypothetical protein
VREGNSRIADGAEGRPRRLWSGTGGRAVTLIVMRSWSPPRCPIAKRVSLRPGAGTGRVSGAKVRFLPQCLEGLDRAATRRPGASSLCLMRSHGYGYGFGGMP